MARFQGNVVLAAGEAGLGHASVAVVTQLFTVDGTYLDDNIGTLGTGRLQAMRPGVRLVLGDEEAFDRLLG